METSTLEAAVYAFFVTAHATLFDVLPAEFSQKLDVFGNWRLPQLTFSLFPALLVLCAGVVARCIAPRDLLHSALAIGIVSCLQASFYWDFSVIPSYMSHLTAIGMVLTAVILVVAPLAIEAAVRTGKAVALTAGPFKISGFTLLAAALVLLNPLFFMRWIPSIRGISSGHTSLVPEFSSDLGAAMILSSLVILAPASVSVFASAVPEVGSAHASARLNACNGWPELLVLLQWVPLWETPLALAWKFPEVKRQRLVRREAFAQKNEAPGAEGASPLHCVR